MQKARLRSPRLWRTRQLTEKPVPGFWLAQRWATAGADPGLSDKSNITSSYTSDRKSAPGKCGTNKIWMPSYLTYVQMLLTVLAPWIAIQSMMNIRTSRMAKKMVNAYNSVEWSRYVMYNSAIRIINVFLRMIQMTAGTDIDVVQTGSWPSICSPNRRASDGHIWYAAVLSPYARSVQPRNDRTHKIWKPDKNK